MDDLKPYLIALAVGLLVGIERENSKIEKQAFGVRTFLLLGLLGAFAGELEAYSIASTISLFAFASIALAYAAQVFSKSDDQQIGLTTEFAAAIVFVAGYMAHQFPILAALTGPMIALILVSKTTLHRFTRAIQPMELKATITILLIAAAVIEFIPDSTIDPLGLFNPKKFGFLVLTLATLEFFSYLLLKITGEKTGALIVGFLGGMVSSTATVISSSRQSQDSQYSWRTLLSTGIAAQIASLLELQLIVYMVSPKLSLAILPSLAPPILMGLVALYFFRTDGIAHYTNSNMASPLNWKSVLRLSFIFGGVLILISLVEKWIGSDATYTLSFVAGLFELQGVSLANATLYSQDQLGFQTAQDAILIAVIASLVAKIAIVGFLARSKMRLFSIFAFAVMVAGIILGRFFSRA